MKLYDGGKAPNPRRVRIFLAEKGVSLPLEPVDMARMEHRSAAFAALNPQRRLPVLVLDDGTMLTESTAICRYLEALHPEPNMFGRTALEVAAIEIATRRIEFDLYGAVAAVFRHLHPSMAQVERQVPVWGEDNKARVAEELALLDARLAGKDYLAASRFSYADIVALTTLDFLRWARLEVPVSCGNLQRYHAALTARPSAKA